MGGRWFANRGQVVQTIAAIIGLCIGGVGLYFVLKNNHSLPQTTAVLYAVLYASGAIAILLLGIWIGRRSTRPTPHVPASEKPEPKETGNAIALGGSARIGDINVYAHPPSVQAIAPPEPEEKKKPRIVFLGAEYIEMNEGLETRGLYRAVGVKGDGMGIVASFRNEDAKVAAYSVRGHVRYRDAEGNEIGAGVSGPLWLDKGTEITDLRPDDSGAIVVLIDGGKQGFAVPWIERRNWRSHRNAAFNQKFQSQSFPVKAEIRLRDRDGDLLLDVPVVLEISRRGDLLGVKHVVWKGN